MSFLNIALLGGALAFLAPLVIHLLNRSRFQRVDWGAMHLLESAMQVNSRRVHWESLLLLLVRCLIPILLAVCLARPVLTYMQVAGSAGDKAFIFLIDDSLSMTVRENAGLSPFERAQAEVRRISSHFHNAESGLWTTGSARDALPGTTFEARRLQSAVESLRVGTGRAATVEALSSCLQKLLDAKNPSKHLVFVSDFRAPDWNAVTEQETLALRKQLASSDPPTQLTLLPAAESIASDQASRSNLSLRFLDQVDFETFRGETKRFALQIQNFGEDHRDNVQISFLVDDQPVSVRAVAIAPNSVEQIVFGCEFATTGFHNVTARIEDQDILDEDNIAHHIVQVVDAARILLITTPDASQFGSSTDFIKLALAPYETASKNHFTVDVVDGDQLSLAQSFPKPSVVIMAGVPKLSEPNTTALVEFVRDGGGLVIFPDDNIDRRWYNDRLLGQDHLLPMQFGQKQNVAPSTKLMREGIQLPKLQVFNNNEAGELYAWEFQAWLEMLPVELASNTSTTSIATEPFIALRMATGAPFLVTQPFGNGTVIQCAASCSDKWSNMPLKPAFVSFIQRLALATVASPPSPNLVAGQAIAISLDPSMKSAASNWFAIQKSEPANEFAMKFDESGGLFTETYFPGVYEIQSRAAVQGAATLVTPDIFSVRAAPSESDLQLLSHSELATIADRLGATVARSADEFIDNMRIQKDGREIWRWFVLGVLILLFAEMFITRGLSRGMA